MDALSPLGIGHSPRDSSSQSYSPHKHVLRPRRSFQRLPFSSKVNIFNSNPQPSTVSPLTENPDALRSPLKLSDGKVIEKSGTGKGAGQSGTKGSRSKGGSLLFPASPDMVSIPESSDQDNNNNNNNNGGAGKTATRLAGADGRSSRDGATLKKLATSFSGAFTVKGRATRAAAKQGFDLSDWNHDLAAIASHPPSSSSAGSTSPFQLSSSTGPTSPSQPRMSTRRTATPALLAQASSSSLRSPEQVLDSSTTTSRQSSGNDMTLLAASESRRRKSDEMEEDDRMTFHGAAPPVRREGPSGHARSHSLAHAHTLRSSRMLSHHASPVASSSTTLSSTAHHLCMSRSSHPGPSFSNPFSSSPSRSRGLTSPSTELADLLSYSAASSTAPPPTKKISLAGLGTIGDFENEQVLMEDEYDGVFGGLTLSGGGPAGALGRAKSLTKPSTPLFSASILPASSSHPGWTGDGLFTNTSTLMTKPGTSLSMGSSHAGVSGDQHMASPSHRPRSRPASSATGLNTLSEMGPAADFFTSPSSPSHLLDQQHQMEGICDMDRSPTLIPPRRRSEPYDLFGTAGPNVPSTSAAPSTGVASTIRSTRRRGSSVSSGSNRAPIERTLAVDRKGASMPDIVDSAGTKPMEKRLMQLMAIESKSSLVGPAGTTHKQQIAETPLLVSSRRKGSLDSLLLSSTRGDLPSSPFNEPGTLTNARGQAEHVNPSVHPMRHEGQGGHSRKRNANGALLVGPGALLGSKLAAVSPIVADPSSPAPWKAREIRNEIGDEEDEEEDDEMMTTEEHDSQHRQSWDRSMSPPPPALTDGTTSASSSLSTSLSSHAEGGEPGVTVFEDGSHHHALSASSSMGGTSGTGGGVFFTPQNYKDVRPLQAAFMSTGLVSKRSRPRTDSIGHAPSYNLQQALLQQQQAERDRVSAVASSLAAAESMANPLLSRISSIMPNTPVKKTAFASNGALPPAADPLAAVSTLSGITDSPCRASAALSRASVSPVSTESSQKTEVAGPSISPCSRHSSSSDSQPACTSDVSPSAHVSRSGARSSLPSAARAWTSGKRPTIFRRRSSGQLSMEGSFLGIQTTSYRGSSVGSLADGSLMDGEPMTPTRSAGQRKFEAAQLVLSPTDTPTTPLMGVLPPQYVLSTAFGTQTGSHLAPLATPHGRQSFPFSDLERRQYLPPTEVGRPQFKARHSGSVLQSVREQEVQQPSWFDANYTVLRSLGNGSFSDAFEVADRQRGGVFAVKRTKNPFGGPKDRLRRLEEVDILRLFSFDGARSPHLIALVDAWEQNGHLYIETELCENGTLAYFLEEFGSENEVLDEARVWKILVEISSGVAHLHHRNVLHLDLKPANIFVTDRGHLKIGDFGLATRWPRADACSIMKGAAVQSPGGGEEGWKPESADRRIRAKSNGDLPEDLEREGDREYIAPEILRGRYGKEADVFSLGLIILEAAANVVLPDNGPAWHKLRSNDFTDVDLSRLSPQLVSLIKGLLDMTPARRFTMGKVIRHPVIAFLGSMLERSLQIEDQLVSGEVMQEVPCMLGATTPEADSFLSEVFSTVYMEGGEEEMSIPHSNDMDMDD